MIETPSAGLQLFSRLRAEQPAVLSKVVALPGDVQALGLGLVEADRHLLCSEVSVVFHVAASVRFNDPFRKAVFTNLRSCRELVDLARDMPHLKVALYRRLVVGLYRLLTFYLLPLCTVK